MKGIVKPVLIGLVLSLLPGSVDWVLAAQTEIEKTNVSEKAGEAKSSDAQLDDLVVTATRTETAIEHIADSVTVITREEIEVKGQDDLYDILNDVPGVSMKRCGAPGQWSYVKMRGGHNDHIKVLINGMSASEPREGGFSSYWSYLEPEDIERIEVVRGPQSSLYGSDAVSGVINIITRKGQGRPTGYLKAEGGSMDTFKGAAGLNGSWKKFSYSLTYVRSDRGGVFEHEEYEADTLSGRFGYDVLENLALDLTLRYQEAWLNYGDTDDTLHKAFDDPHSYKDTRLFFSSIGLNHKIATFWEHNLSFAYTDNKSEYDDPDDGLLDAEYDIYDGFLKGENYGKRKEFQWQHNFYVLDIDTISAGYANDRNEGGSSYEDENHGTYGESDSVFSNHSYFINNQLLLMDKALSFACGGRLDDHSQFGDHTTYKLGLAYSFRALGLKLKATHGTGFKAPTMFQLFDTTYGNLDLKPEESTSYDVGFEQRLFGGKVLIEATYFNNEFENLIAFDYGTWHYINSKEAESYGVETGLRFYPMDQLSAAIFYTYTDGEENDTDLTLVPKHDWTFNLTFTPGNLRISTDIFWVGERLSYDPDYQLDSYTRVDVAAAYQLYKYLKLFGRIENLFDEEYEDGIGFPAPDLSAWAGVKVTY